jgi:hypothetical protein
MSGPNAHAEIRFPASYLGDDEVRNFLAMEEDIIFDEEGNPHLEYYGDDFAEIKESVDVTTGKVTARIFCLKNNEAPGGEFRELEELLVGKGIPFDRVTEPDWGVYPCRRAFRPPSFDHTYYHDYDGEEIITVRVIRGLLLPATFEEGTRSPLRRLALIEQALEAAAPSGIKSLEDIDSEG